MDKNDNSVQLFKNNDPYNPGFPMQYFNKNIESKMYQADKMVDSLLDAIVKESSTLAIAAEKTNKDYRLVVDASDEILKAIKEGKLKLAYNKKGDKHAQLINSDGTYSKKLPIKEEYIAKEVSPIEMANALQLKALQNQLENLTEQIEKINYGVLDILKGQQNDRIGLYYSAISLMIESNRINDEQLKRLLMVQGIKSLSDAIFQLNMKFKDDIFYLTSKEYENVKKKRVETIERKMSDINQSFAFIHQAMILKAAAYCSMNEFTAMTAVLEEYSKFIENDIKDSAHILAQLDSNDTGLENGIWKSRALLTFDSIDFSRLLYNDENILLEDTEEN